MSGPRTFALIAVLVAALTACGGSSQAPAGRWEGFAESGKWLLAVRLQVDPGNTIRATALSVSIDGVALPRRLELTRKIKSTLIAEWPDAVVGKVDYKDGNLTRAGGYATLFAFDPKSRTMTFHFYAAGRLAERVKLYPVRNFAGTPG